MSNKQINQFERIDESLSTDDVFIVDQKNDDSYQTRSVGFDKIQSQITQNALNSIVIDPVNQIQNLFYPGAMPYDVIEKDKVYKIPFDCALFSTQYKLIVNGQPIFNNVLNANVRFTPHNTSFIQIFLQSGDEVQLDSSVTGSPSMCLIPIRGGKIDSDLFTEYTIPFDLLFDSTYNPYTTDTRKFWSLNINTGNYISFKELDDEHMYQLKDKDEQLIGTFKIFRSTTSSDIGNTYRITLQYKIESNYSVKFYGIENINNLRFSTTSLTDSWASVNLLKNPNSYLKCNGKITTDNFLSRNDNDHKQMSCICFNKTNEESWDTATPALKLMVYKKT